jgi:hypothetical protein
MLNTKPPDYCCLDFEKAVDYNDIWYYRPEDDKAKAVKKAGWYMYSLCYDRPIVVLEPFKYCPWCARKLAKPM